MMRVSSVYPRIVLAAAILALAVGLTDTAWAQASGSKPNIIFVFTDDMGYGDLGVLHQNQRTGKKHATPNIDRFAAEGIQLRRHYCPAPVCAPSRASLLRGLHQGHTEVRNSDFDKELPDNHTLGTVMQGAGYRTLHVGKYGLQGIGETKKSILPTSGRLIQPSVVLTNILVIFGTWMDTYTIRITIGQWGIARLTRPAKKFGTMRRRSRPD
jgi:hypothetical protein